MKVLMAELPTNAPDAESLPSSISTRWRLTRPGQSKEHHTSSDPKAVSTEPSGVQSRPPPSRGTANEAV